MMKINNPADYKVALYLRLSKEDDNEHDESLSITNQDAFLKDWCKQNALAVAETFIDDGISGMTEKRPEYQRMLEWVRTGKVNMVATKDLSRLSRDAATTINLVERFFPEHNTRYIAVMDSIDTGIESASNDMTPFKAIMNEYHAKETSKKVKATKNRDQREGKFVGGKAAYGYVISNADKHRLDIDPAVAPIVRRMFEMSASGISSRQIAVTFNDEAIPTPATYAGLQIKKKGLYSGRWSTERINFMLQNELYTGNMVQGRTKNLSYKSDKVIKMPKDQLIVVPNTHEPLVSREVFDKVQAQIRSRERTRYGKHDFLIKGLIFCHECGKPLGVLPRKRADGHTVLNLGCRTYMRFTKDSACTLHYVPLDLITEKVVDQLREICELYLNREKCEQVAQIAREELRQRNNDEQELKRVIKKQEQIQKHIDKLLEQQFDGVLENEDFQRMYQNKTTERVFLQRQETVIRERMAVKPIDEPIDHLIERFLNSVEVNRELLVSLVERIEFTEGKEILINFKFRNLALISAVGMQKTQA